jgi:hypothetical protein
MFFNQAAMPVDQREQDIFQRMRTAMSPEEERQRLEMEQRMAAQGRLGVRTAQFGGTPEQLAMAKAQEGSPEPYRHVERYAVCRTQSSNDRPS